MTVHLTSVSISGVTLSGSGLQFLLNTFLIPRFPNAVIDRPFPLSDNIDRIEVDTGRATVFRKRNRSSLNFLNRVLRQPDAIRNTDSFVSIAYQEQARLHCD